MHEVAPGQYEHASCRRSELATARAVASVGVPFILSTASTRSIKAVAKVDGDRHQWYQLYWYMFSLSTLHKMFRILTC